MKNIRLIIIMLFLAAVFQNCEEAFEDRLENRTITLLAPVNNLTTADTLQTFYWEIMDGATKYQLQIVSPRFDSIIKLIADTIILSNRIDMDLNTGNYQWRVRGANSSSFSAYSNPWKLQIQ